MENRTITDRLSALRQAMAREKIDFYMIPTADFHNSEYVNDYFKVREFFCGFTGSNGTLVVWKEGAGLWTDGRYFIQAENELTGTGVTLFRMLQEGVPTIEEFLQKENAPILIQLVSPVSKDRIPEILKDARGFVYCVSSMGVTGQEATFHKSVIDYLGSVKEVSKIPVMMGFGIRTAEDVAPMKDIIDGAIVGSHFIRLMEENDYDLQAIGTYCGTFKKELNQ